jgi:hypothetical protein
MNNPFSSEVFAIILLVGGIATFLRPKQTFIAVLFLTCALPNDVLTFTRLAGLGPWFNLRDAFLVIVLLCGIVYLAQKRRKARLPLAVIGMFIITILGGIHTYIAYEPDIYLFARMFRLYLNFPLFFIAGAFIIDSEEDSYWIIRAVVAGSVVISFLYFGYLIENNARDGYVSYRFFRQLSFGAGLVPWVAVALLIGILTKQIQSRTYRIGAVGLIAIFLLVTLLQQTRSVWIASIAVLFILLLSLMREQNFNLKAVINPLRIILIVVVAGIGLVLGNRLLGTLVPGLSFQTLVENRASADDAGRGLAISIELQTWLESSLIWGHGMGYALFSDSPLLRELTIGLSELEIAFGHVGHVNALSEYGIIGYVVSYVFFPATIIQACRRLLVSPISTPSTRMLALMNLILMIWLWIVYLFSGSFNGLHSFSPMLLGATWSLWYQQSLAAQAPAQAPTVPAPAAATRLQPWQTRQ